MPEIEERVREWLRKRARKSAAGRVLSKGVMASLRAEVLDDPVAIRKTLVLLLEDGLIQYTPNERGEPISSYIRVSKPTENVPAHIQSWLSVLQQKNLSQSDMDALIPIADSLADFSQQDMVLLLKGLLKLRHDQTSMHGRPGYLVSAEYLLGSSKLLSSLPKRALKAFGIDAQLFPSHPLYVVVAGPTKPNAVILVENPAAFECAAKSSAAKHCAFVATFGFGLSKAAEDFGNQLAGMVEDRFSHAITLVREGSSSPPAKELLRNPNITFWGDLDMAGMEIYERIARCVPAVKLSALYGPMIEAVTVGDQRHPYVAAVGKPGQTMFQASREDALTMLGYCSEWAVDQEMVSLKQVEKLAGLVLKSED